MSFNKVLFILLINSIILFSQENKPTVISSKNNELPKFSLKMNMNRNTLTNYKYKEITEVERTMSDSSQIKFKREATYYFTLKVPNNPDNGFSSFDISIDSLDYKFYQDNEVYEYNSQDDKPNPVSFEDLKTIIVPLGKEFNITYSPYGEVVNVEGESLDWLRNYVTVEGKGVLDSIQNYIWLDGISKQRLASISDPKKILLPVNQVQIDSTWNSFMEFQVMNITCFDSSKAKIVNVNNGIFRIMGESTKINATNNPVRFYGFKDYFVNIIKTDGKGKYDMVFGPRGLMRTFTMDYDLTITGKVKMEVFTDKIKTKQSWDFINQYKY